MIRFAAPALLTAAIFAASASSSLADTSKSIVFTPKLKPTSAANTAAPSENPRATPSDPDIGFMRPVLAPGATALPGGMALADQAEAAGPALRSATVVLKSGDSLLGALVRGGLSAAEAYRDLVKLSGQIDARKLKPGDKLVLGFFSDRSRRRLATLTLSGRRGKIASVVLLPGAVGSKSLSADRGMIVKTLAVRGSPSLPRTLTELGLPPQVSEQIIMAISQSKKPPVHGEMLKIVYQVPKAPGSGSAPRLSYASYTGRDGRAHVLNYTALPTPPALQHIDVMPAALVALWDPLPGARISSPYGWRLHPVFHTRLFHKGVDYESAAGTAVIAAADGVVEDAGWRGNYGNYIRIRHSGRLETAYAHLAGFAPALEPGAPIHRGEVIGYVGMTGVATGPHLYYEVLVDGRQIDPEGSALKEATRRLTTQTARAP
jgi:murein DD-endopeptidase MepM/ murein hydrolase activator NlpD